MSTNKDSGFNRDAGIAGADLSNALFRFCTKASNGTINLAAAGAAVDGIIYETAPQGRPVTFVMAGAGTIAKVEAAATLATGARVVSDATGKAVAAAAATAPAVGVVRNGGVSGDIIEIYFRASPGTP